MNFELSPLSLAGACQVKSEALIVLVNLKLTLAIVFHADKLDSLIHNGDEDDWKELVEVCLLNGICDYHLRIIQSMTSQQLSMPLAVEQLRCVKICLTNDSLSAEVASSCARGLYNLYRLGGSQGEDFRQRHSNRQKDAFKSWLQDPQIAFEEMEVNVELLSCLLSTRLWSEYEDVAFCSLPFMTGVQGSESKIRIQCDLDSLSQKVEKLDVHFVDQVSLVNIFILI